MISFTDDRLYAKGTCNVICSDVNTGDVLYQSNKVTTGNVTPSVNLNEIRAGLSNPIATMIPSDSSLQVDFEAADFQIWAKSAQMGAALSYGAPAQTCQIVTAASTTLAIDVSGGAPVAPFGYKDAFCFVQTVGAESKLLNDGVAYPISSAGTISNFVATASTKYKVTYYVQKVAARKAVISSFIDPKVVRFECQIAVYSNRGGTSEGTRVGWLYYTIPYLKLQADATVTGDQGNNDTTKISGQALAYDSSIVSETCSDCDSSTLAYLVYVPDDVAEEILGITIIGGAVSLVEETTAQLRPYIVMADKSIVVPNDFSTGFSYEMTTTITGTSVSSAGLITAGTTAGSGEVTITYTPVEGTSFTCPVNVTVTAS